MKLKIPKDTPLFYTSDEHYDHILRCSNRPYSSVDEMNEDIISKFNEVVPPNGFTIHGGDFYLGRNKKEVYNRFISRLNGNHFFVMGSHDKWLDNRNSHEIVELRIDNQIIVICHYAMRVWPASHYNSWHLYGHSHGNLPSEGKSHDISVDNTGFYPLSHNDIINIMVDKPDNFNLVSNRRY